MDLPWGMFGENFTTEGLLESELNIGDKLRIGSATIMVTEPRMPCYKLGLKFGRADIIRRFMKSERTGFYFAVLQEGEVGAGDRFEVVERDKHGVTISDLTRLYVRDRENVSLLKRASEVEALPEGWRKRIQNQLERLAQH
jgi:MOSC domain-containing protein YiiM